MDLVPVIRKCIDDLLLVFRAESFKCDPQFHCRIAVDGNELVVLELNDISVDAGNDPGYSVQFARLVGKAHRDREDPVSHDETLLNDAGHCDDVHIAAAEDGYHFFAPAANVFESGNCQKAGILDDHFVIFHHIEEGDHQV